MARPRLLERRQRRTVIAVDIEMMQSALRLGRLRGAQTGNGGRASYEVNTAPGGWGYTYLPTPIPALSP
ncbi:hypothetical protein ACOMHN_060083 [Nucella lapillus]